MLIRGLATVLFSYTNLVRRDVKRCSRARSDLVKSVSEKGITMKRTDITSLFPEATDEQINALMSINGNDINNAKRGVEELQTSLSDAQSKLKEMENNSASLQEAIDRANGLQSELDSMKAAETIRITREEVAKSVGVPAHLLTADTKEECEAQAQSILEFAKPSRYPVVPDGGEPLGNPKKETRDQFADYFNQVL